MRSSEVAKAPVLAAPEHMDLSIPLVVGLIAGLVASILAGASGYGLFGDLVFGVAGALVGDLVFQAFDWHAPYAGFAGDVVVAGSGAVLGVLALRLMKRSTDHAPRPPRR